MPVQIRSYKNEDLPLLVRLLNRTKQGSYEFFPFTEQKFQQWIIEGKFEILLAELNGETIGSVAYSDGHWGEEIRWLAVTENPVSKLVEESLVKEIEKHVKRSEIFTSVDAGSIEIDKWMAFGYRCEGGLCHMQARLDGVKTVPKAPDGIVMRSLRPDEEMALVEAVNAGFGWERLKMGLIQRWKEDCPPFTEDWIRVAENNDRLISVVASRTDADYNKRFGGKRGYLGPAATLPEFRGKNLASILTRRAMNLLFEKGLDSVALYTSEQNVASTTLLRKLGFEVAHQWKFMRKNLTQNETQVLKNREPSCMSCPDD